MPDIIKQVLEHWHWGVVLMLLRTLPRLFWNVVISYPAGKIKDQKIAELVELDQIKQDQIDSLKGEVERLRGQTGSSGSSSASPVSTPTSATTPM